MKLLNLLLKGAMFMTLASCAGTVPKAAKKPFPTDPSEQEYALFYDGSGYEAPVMGWTEARNQLMTGGTPR